ncbi:MAG: hypothetical protein R3A48_12830 [Polyangiales bacterium]
MLIALGVAVALAVGIPGALTVLALLSEGEAVRVHPAIRALDAGRER